MSIDKHERLTVETEAERIERFKERLEQLLNRNVVIVYKKQNEEKTLAGRLVAVGNNICRLNGAIDVDKVDPDQWEDAIESSTKTPSIGLKFITDAYEL